MQKDFCSLILGFTVSFHLDFAALVATTFHVCSAVYTASDDVVELTASNFNNKVIQSDDVWLVEFYAPW